MEVFDNIEQTLTAMRVPKQWEEKSLHTAVLKRLRQSGFPAEHEVKLGPRCRIDILSSGVGIEIKLGRPNRTALIKQLTRYAASPLVSALLVVCEHGLSLPAVIQNKAVRVVSLQRLWGLAMPAGGSVQKPKASARAETVADSPAPSPDAQAAPRHTEHTLPGYLQTPPPATRVYGTLSFNRRRKCWMIQGDPAVTEMAKRLFPGADKGKRGFAYFSANRRGIGDMNWLMQRFPLDIAAKDLDIWEKGLAQAREHYVRLEQFQSGRLPEVSLPDGSFHGTLRAFQQAGLNWLYHTPRALLADEMGLGKTVQAIACLAALNAYPALFVVPPHLVRNWQTELNRFLRVNGKEPEVHVLKGLKPYPLPPADVYVMHYLLLRGWKENLPAFGFRAVVFDEIQELRHAGTEKYSAASLLSDSAERVIGLSGTPIYNLGGEIWNVTNILERHFLGDWESFTREWCYGYGNAIVAKPDLLGAHLKREGIMLRRTKAEVLPELPDKRRFVQEIDEDSAVYRQMMAPVIEDLKKLHEAGDLTPSQRALLEGHISQGQRQATGLAKAPYAAQFVRALVESGERVLLFAHHHAVMDVYKKELRAFSPVFITGRETGEQKERAVKRFMEGATDLCCISLRAAAGLNLQRATCVVFGELDWSPAVHSQAEDRAHRIGQKDSLLCYYLVCPEGSDREMQEALGLKVSQFMGLMGEAPQSQPAALEASGYAKRHAEKLLREWLQSRLGV